MAKIGKVNLLDGLVAKRGAGGCNGATRWEIYPAGTDFGDHTTTFDAWLGDIVRWTPGGVWDWQPRDAELETFASPAEAIAAITKERASD
jgi:hypothetical protein